LFEARAGFARRLHGLVDRIGGLVRAHLGNVE
jgi:hypothetical protein